MTKKEQLKLIRNAYDEIPDLQDGFFDVRERLLDMNLVTERAHRKCQPYALASNPWSMSIRDAAKLFVVSHLLDGWKESNKYTVDDILWIRNECLYAQAYAKKHYEELTNWAIKYGEPFSHVNYMVSMESNPVAA